MRNEDDLMPPHRFLHFARVKVIAYNWSLYPLTTFVTRERLCILQQDPPQSHTVHKSPKWMLTVLIGKPSSTCCPLLDSYANINRMAYYACGVVERNSTSHTDNNVTALK